MVISTFFLPSFPLTYIPSLLPCPASVPVEAADLVALTQPWEEREGRRELLLVSPAGMARHWPDLHSPRRFTDVDARSVALGQSVRTATVTGCHESSQDLCRGDC